LLESIRQYALDRLIASGEVDEVRRRHATFYVEYLDWMATLTRAEERFVQMPRLERNYPNLRAVFVACRDAAGARSGAVDLTLGLRLVIAWGRACLPRGTHAEGLAWVEAMLERAGREPSHELAAALVTAGVLAEFLGNAPLSRERLAAGTATARQVGDVESLAAGLILVSALPESGEAGATRLDRRREGDRLLRQMNLPALAGIVYQMAGIAAYHLGDTSTARTLDEEAAQAYRSGGLQGSVAECLVAMGDFAREEGDDDRAMRLYLEALDGCRVQPPSGTVGSALQNLGILALRRGDLEKSSRYLAEALTTVQQLLDRRGIAECLAVIAGLTVARGRFEQAAILFGASDATFAAARATPWPANRAENDRYRSLARSRLGERAFAAAYAEGQAIPTERAVSLGVAETARNADSSTL
jgi:non-specific serine/threonine protein kinase